MREMQILNLTLFVNENSLSLLVFASPFYRRSSLILYFIVLDLSLSLWSIWEFSRLRSDSGFIEGVLMRLNMILIVFLGNSLREQFIHLREQK